MKKLVILFMFVFVLPLYPQWRSFDGKIKNPEPIKEYGYILRHIDGSYFNLTKHFQENLFWGWNSLEYKWNKTQGTVLSNEGAHYIKGMLLKIEDICVIKLRINKFRNTYNTKVNKIHTPKYDTLVVDNWEFDIDRASIWQELGINRPKKYLILEDIKYTCPGAYRIYRTSVCMSSEIEDVGHTIWMTETMRLESCICKSCGNIYVARKQVLKRIK